MRAKLISIPLPARTASFALALLCFSLITFSPLYTPISSAQEIDFQKSIDATSEALIALDVKASDCLAALNSAENASALCDDFLADIDGDLMANYILQCRALKEWRDEYVDQTVSSELESDVANNEEMLRRLVSIEFTCGENTLRNRTQFVFAAFSQLRNGSAPSASNVTAIQRRLSQSRFNALDSSERQRLQDALSSQQHRSQRESDQQFNDLENELIRQQIRNSNLPN